jgi:hypothetical protein
VPAVRAIDEPAALVHVDLGGRTGLHVRGPRGHAALRGQATGFRIPREGS